MIGLLTPAEVAQAASEGWALEDIYVTPMGRWLVQILPARGHALFPYAGSAGAHVVGQARAGQALHLKALRLVVADIQRKKK